MHSIFFLHSAAKNQAKNTAQTTNVGYREKRRDRVYICNEGLLVLLLFNNKEHRLEQFICLLSLYPRLWAGEKESALTVSFFPAADEPLSADNCATTV